MKTKFWLVATCLLGLSLVACERKFNNEEPSKPKKEEPTKPTPSPNTGNEVSGGIGVPFSVRPKNPALLLAGKPAEEMKSLLLNLEIKGLIPLGETEITAEQLAEIKQEADKLVAGAKTQRQKHDILLKWVKNNVKYGGDVSAGSGSESFNNVHNTAYNTFKNREAICQGYANLLKVMCYTQGINAPVVNGFAYFYGPNSIPGGHAWNYAHLDGQWVVSDPTNRQKSSEINDFKDYEALQPTRIDFLLGQSEDFDCMFTGGEVTIQSVKKSKGNSLRIPDNFGGFVVTSFNPISIAKEVTEIYLGTKVKNLGADDSRRLTIEPNPSGANLARLYIDAANPFLEDYHGTIYSKERNKTDKIIFIPKQLKVVKIKPFKVFDKESGIKNLPGLEELHFGAGTEELQSSAVENCPKLKKVYVPKGTKIDAGAFYNCPKNIEIIEQ